MITMILITKLLFYIIYIQVNTIRETNRIYSLFIRAVIETSERVSKVFASSIKIEI